MNTDNFIKHITELGISTFAGVPDSTLKDFCAYLNDERLDLLKHYTVANEGAAVGLAVGTYLATGKPACIYMQNSGIGNIVNPMTSLANKEVYDIPMLLVIGWRGEPGTSDEPQHKFMGSITERMLESLDISYKIISNENAEEDVLHVFQEAKEMLKNNRQYAIVIKRNVFTNNKEIRNKNNNTLIREEAISAIVKFVSQKDILVSTTGKISRELYEESDAIWNLHSQDFLTVGGMGHASMIAFGIALSRPGDRVYCLDGDGAILMHMGALGILGHYHPNNLIHICFNNSAHESVGGMPTGAPELKFADIAQNCGYSLVFTVTSLRELKDALFACKISNKLSFIEIKVALGARADLGRPKESAVQNKINFMTYHGVI